MKIFFLGYIFDIGRNDLCLCKSGKKFKKCCLVKIDGDNPAKEIMDRPKLRPKRWMSKKSKWGRL